MNLKAMAVVASGVVASIASGDAVQWRVEDGGNGHWYELRSDSLIWTAARVEAQSSGGDLVALETVAELEWVGSRVPAAYFLAGGVQDLNASQVGSGWRWVTGVAIDGFSVNFDDNPCGASDSITEDGQQDYVEIVGAVIGDINAGPQPNCSDVGARQFIIEWSADCNNDSIVDYGQCRDGTLPDYNSNNVPDCCEQGVACHTGEYSVEWKAEDGGNAHWYQRISVTPPVSFELIRSFAVLRGGDLASIVSEQENGFVRSVAAPIEFLKGVAVGLRTGPGCTASGWSDGTAFQYSAWAPGQPDCAGDTVGFYPDGWHDLYDYHVFGYVIEWSADCNSDGVVDYGQILRGELADTDANGVPDICDPCVADIVQDGLVNGIDLAAVLNNWGTKGGVIDADVNSDGIVDGSDLSIVLNGWGTCP